MAMENRYDKYKDSGVAWIGEIPEHWILKRIKNICDNLDYLREPISAEHRLRNNPIYDYYGASGVIDKIDFYNVDDQVLLIGEDGANLVMRNLPLVYKAKGKFWVNNHAHILKPRNDDYDFCAYAFEAADYSLFITGSAQPKLSQENLGRIMIAIPPLLEQQSVAAYLDQKCGEIDELITLQEEMITKLQSYKQSVITEAVTKGLNKNVPLKDSGVEWIVEIPKHWVVKRLKYVCDFNPQNDQSISKLSEVGYLPMERLKNGYMLPSVISVSNLTQGLTFFKENDIVLAKVTPCFENGNIAIAKNLVNNCGFGSSELFVFRVKSINRKYLFYLLQEGKIRDVCKSTMIGTGGLKRISPIFMKNIQLPIPSLSEQQSIADYLDQRCSEIDELISIKQQKIEKLKEYKKSLIFECVTGKRKVS